MKKQIDPNIYCVMLGANKRDEKGRHKYSASRIEYVVENKTKALQVYSEYCEQLNQFKAEEWTSGIVQMFNPIILPNGHYTTYSTEANICEFRFGYQEEKNQEVENETIIEKKTKAPMRRGSKNRNF